MDPRRKCVDLTGQIARIQKSLDDLIRDRDELQNFIDAHLALVSPVVLSLQLRHIFLRNIRILSDSALLKFIQARTGPHLHDVAHLTIVRVEFLHPMEVDILPPLREFLAAGLKVTWDYKPAAEPGPTYSPSEGLLQVDDKADLANVLCTLLLIILPIPTYTFG
ncbi:hypothetical protein C8J57DRAFT_1327407 [Mycena rebaudengoi]|nr:hypothetical protein C8J57DRAFT_1327407 [Mycena rebaudengoi]